MKNGEKWGLELERCGGLEAGKWEELLWMMERKAEQEETLAFYTWATGDLGTPNCGAWMAKEKCF